MILPDLKFFQSIQDPVFVVNTNYKILYINKSWAAIHGKTDDELTGKRCYEQFHGITEPCISCSVEPVFILEKTSVSERWITLSNGKRRCGEIRSYPVFDSSETVVAATTIIVDITDKKEKGIQEHKPAGIKFTLSKRERQILELVSRGYTNPEISQHLGISINTVKTHIVNIFNKIGVSDRTQAAIIALKNQLI